MIYLRLYLEFFKIGLFSVGGGLATLPFLQDLVEKYGWVTNSELIDMIGISESTPGPIGINMATFMGYRAGGFKGGLVASLGIVTPSIIIIVIIAKILNVFLESKLVKSGFKGINASVVGLIASVAFSLGKISVLAKDQAKNIVLLVVSLIFIRKVKLHPIVYILIGAGVGLIFSY